MTEDQKFLLADFVEAYLPLDEEQEREFERLLSTEPYKEVQAMRVTMAQKAEARGLLQGQRKILSLQLEERFGSLNPQVHERLESLPAERLEELARSLLRARSLQELALEDGTPASTDK
jgi:hypothetical protein